MRNNDAAPLRRLTGADYGRRGPGVLDDLRNVISGGGGVRIPLHGYNDSNDIQALANALAEVGRALR